MLILTPSMLQTVRRSLSQDQKILSGEMSEDQFRSPQGRRDLIPSSQMQRAIACSGQALSKSELEAVSAAGQRLEIEDFSSVK